MPLDNTEIAYHAYNCVSSVKQGGGCKGISCGFNCCANTDTCITPQGFGGSYCSPGPGGRRLNTLDSSAAKESLLVRNIRVGAINITGIKGASASVDEVAHALSGLVVNATVSPDHNF